MELKEYQKKSLTQVKQYLEVLAEYKNKNDKAVKIDPEYAIDFPQKAWEKVNDNPYHSRKNGLNEHLPNFYLKIPTGGGKTVLACHCIELINRIYLKKQTGIILWIVPTTQIYRQILGHLKNREHPYRQVLDVTSGGRTVILEKGDRFTVLDVKENLVVMLLMLPSANRQNKEVLKIFQDNGGFAEFFPAEDDNKGNEELFSKFTNLDCFLNDKTLFNRVIKTSLGNTLRILKSVIIIDEGHKAYSEKARDTIANFNPSILVELSATPPQGSNNLVSISGQELNREEMIKLDMHITNKASIKWQDTIRAAFERRNSLEKTAKKYEASTGEYIRPICLIQVERTGSDQRGLRYVHAEDVKEYLLKQCGITNGEIAIKSSEKDDIEGIDLLSKECPIRYIITKYALQEGWDCAFAYILAVLTNPSSQLSITQLVGRILRQPKARKTKVKELDESYIFCHRPKANEILGNIRTGFEDEGLGDIAGRVIVDEGDTQTVKSTSERAVRYREQFKQFAGKIYLPKFVIQEKDSWRDVSYEMDILSRIDWMKVDLSNLKNITLTDTVIAEENITVNLNPDVKKLIDTKEEFIRKTVGIDFNQVFITRQIIDIIPNPWLAYEISQKAMKIFLDKYDKELVVNNIVFIIEEIRKHLESEKDKLAEQIFKGLIEKKTLWFFLLSGKAGYKLPSSIKVKNNAKMLIRNDNTAVQQYLFEFAAEDEFNSMEKAIALYLDEQEKLLWWYRNLVGNDYYSIQGWKKQRVYPDFVFTNGCKKNSKDYSKVYVVESKGVHLKNEDTDYKRSIFELCNKLGEKKDWRELELEFSKKKFEFQVIFGDEWQNKVNKLFGF